MNRNFIRTLLITPVCLWELVCLMYYNLIYFKSKIAVIKIVHAHDTDIKIPAIGYPHLTTTAVNHLRLYQSEAIPLKLSVAAENCYKANLSFFERIEDYYLFKHPIGRFVVPSYSPQELRTRKEKIEQRLKACLNARPLLGCDKKNRHLFKFPLWRMEKRLLLSRKLIRLIYLRWELTTYLHYRRNMASMNIAEVENSNILPVWSGLFRWKAKVLDLPFAWIAVVRRYLINRKINKLTSKASR